MEILINIFIAIISIIFTLIITDRYYKKSLSDQEKQWEKARSLLIAKIESSAATDKLVLYEKRIIEAIQDYRRRGTPKFIIDIYTDLSLAEKEKMYDDVLLRVKGRVGKNNPYRQS